MSSSDIVIASFPQVSFDAFSRGLTRFIAQGRWPNALWRTLESLNRNRARIPVLRRVQVTKPLKFAGVVLIEDTRHVVHKCRLYVERQSSDKGLRISLRRFR